MDSVEETFHLLDGITDEDSLEVVAILQAMTDTRCNGIDVLQNTCIFYANNIIARLRLHIVAGKHLGKQPGLPKVGATNSKVGKSVQGNLFGMTRTTKYRKILFGNIIHLIEIIGTDEVLVGHNALDGCYNQFVAKTDMKAFEMSFQVRRWRNKDKCLACLHNLIYIALEGNAVHVEVNTGEICRIVAEALEVFNAIVAPEVPPYMVVLLEKHLGNGCCPTASTQYCYVS